MLIDIIVNRAAKLTHYLMCKCINKLSHVKKLMHICKFLLIYLNLLNSVKEKFHYSIKLWLFDNQINLSN